MKVSHKKLQEYFEDTLPSPEKLAEAFSFHFAEVESVEKEGDDTILNVKVLPDRAGYAKSYEGIALEASAILGLKRTSSGTEMGDRSIEFNPQKIRETLGTEISTADIISILKKLDLGVEEKGDSLVVRVPVNRTDLQDWRDIPEEIARIYGYDKIPAKIPGKNPAAAVNKKFYYADKIKNILVDWGFSEVYTYTLTSKGDFHIEKSVASDKNYLRPNLLEGITKSLELNAKNVDLLGLDAITIFEIGNVFCEEGEHTALSIGIKNTKKKQEKENEKIKKVRDELLKIIDAGATILCTVDDSGGLISVGGKTIGISNHTEGVMELNLDALIETLPEPTSSDDLNLGPSVSIEYKKFSHYPFMVRDIAVFVPDAVSTDEVWNSIKKGIEDAGAQELIARHSLFDTFKKDRKVSYAFRMIFQSMEKTLTDEEVNKVMEKVNTEVKGKGWEVR